MSAGAPAAAQQKFPPDTFVNLQIFPKGAPPDVVIGAMKNFTRALGVRCPCCHVGDEGMTLDTFDFVADTKPTKQIARMMMRIAEHPQHAPAVPKPPGP